MTEKLQGIEKRYKELTLLLSDPDVISDREQWQKYAKEHSDYEEVMQLYGEYKKLISDIGGCEEIIKSGEDEELSQLAKADLEELKEKRGELETKIKKLLLPADPDDNKNARGRAATRQAYSARCSNVCIPGMPSVCAGNANS